MQPIRVLMINCDALPIEQAGGGRVIKADRVTDIAAASVKILKTAYRLIVARFPLGEQGPKDLMYFVRHAPQTLCKQTSVVAIVNHRDQKLIQEGINAGVNDYVPNPVSGEDLERMVAKFAEQAVRRDAKLIIKAKVDLPLHDQPFYCQALNLSRSGMLMVCDRELIMGSPINLQFTLPGDPNPVLASSVIVREARGPRTKSFAYGLTFTYLDAAGSTRLTAFSG